MQELERRSWAECRGESDGVRIRGYALKFHALSLDLGGFREQIHPDAVDRTIRDSLDVRALVDHDASKVIGRRRAGTLELRKDSQGLFSVITPDPQISYAGDILRAVARGDVSGMSFGFKVVEDIWDYDAKEPLRTIMDMEIHEVSIVSFPAYVQTDVSVAQRSLEAYQREQGPARLRYWQAYHKTQLAKHL